MPCPPNKDNKKNSLHSSINKLHKELAEYLVKNPIQTPPEVPVGVAKRIEKLCKEFVFYEINEGIMASRECQNAIFRIQKAVENAAKRLKLPKFQSRVERYDDGYELFVHYEPYYLPKDFPKDKIKQMDILFNSYILIEPAAYFEQKLEKNEATAVEYRYGDTDLKHKLVRNRHEIKPVIRAIADRIIRVYDELR